MTARELDRLAQESADLAMAYYRADERESDLILARGPADEIEKATAARQEAWRIRYAARQRLNEVTKEQRK